ncbi:MAG: hypothetical protein H6623_04710 [Bdellovibrionaceae bacterium]|nr:hypothetical protein [Pseudobdellovibrionaceae bacterium]
MRFSFFTLLVFFLTQQSIACPQIGGSYTCQTDSGVGKVIINQYMEDGFDVFEVEGIKYKADNIWYPKTKGDVVSSYSATCESNKVQLGLSNTIYDDAGIKISESAMTFYLYETTQGLVHEQKGFFATPEYVIPIQEIMLCQKD